MVLAFRGAVQASECADPRVAVAGATQILDRSYGRPVQSVNVDREET
jgi:hypothetical protein